MSAQKTNTAQTHQCNLFQKIRSKYATVKIPKYDQQKKTTLKKQILTSSSICIRNNPMTAHLFLWLSQEVFNHSPQEGLWQKKLRPDAGGKVEQAPTI